MVCNVLCMTTMTYFFYLETIQIYDDGVWAYFTSFFNWSEFISFFLQICFVAVRWTGLRVNADVIKSQPRKVDKEDENWEEKELCTYLL